jgi:hypothetical protein
LREQGSGEYIAQVPASRDPLGTKTTYIGSEKDAHDGDDDD